MLSPKVEAHIEQIQQQLELIRGTSDSRLLAPLLLANAAALYAALVTADILEEDDVIQVFEKFLSDATTPLTEVKVLKIPGTTKAH